MKRANICCSAEESNPMNDSRQRLGDIYMPEFEVFGDAFFDISVINICAASYIEHQRAYKRINRFDMKRK